MGLSGDQPDPVQRALQRASAARARAQRLVEIYQRLEHQAATATAPIASILLDTAARQRESERRFRAVARLHQQHAHHLAHRVTAAPRGADPHETDPHETGVSDAVRGSGSFITAISEYLAEPSAGLALIGTPPVPISVAASDTIARAALDCELSIGEGPAHDVAADETIGQRRPLVSGDLGRQWPLWGSMIAPLGVRTIVAAPLLLEAHCVAALLTFHPSVNVGAGHVDRVADLAASLSHTLHAPPDTPWSTDSEAVELLLEETDIQPATHQAAGMLFAQLGISITDAYALLRARAFATDHTLNALAAKVIAGEIDLSARSDSS